MDKSKSDRTIGLELDIHLEINPKKNMHQSGIQFFRANSPEDNLVLPDTHQIQMCKCKWCGLKIHQKKPTKKGHLIKTHHASYDLDNKIPMKTPKRHTTSKES